MAYDFQSRLDMLGPKNKARNHKEYVYTRGATEETLIGTPIIYRADEVSSGVPVTRIEFQDIVFDTADLFPTFGSPQPDDEILGPDGDVFIVSSRGNDGPPFDYTTSSRKRIRVFTLRQSIG